MKKIAVVVYDISILGGAEKVSVNVANELANYYDVTILSIHGSEKNPSYSIRDNIEVDYLGIHNARLRRQLLSTFMAVLKYLKFHSIDVALLEGNYCAFLCSFARLFVQTNLIFCDHGSFLSQYNERSIRFIRRISTSLCHHTVVLTERSRGDYIDYFHLPKDKVSCIYNWISHSYYESEIQYDSHSNTIISVGRFGKEKGYDLLVRVAEIVLPKHKEWKWELYGDGETFSEIKARIEEVKLEQQLLLKGVYDDIDSVYGKAAFLVLPSYREGMPLALLEAKYHKLPLVSFDIITGPREIILDNVNGFLVEPYNIMDMAMIIEKLIEDPTLRQDLSNHAYDNIKQFEKDEIVLKWRNLIDNME